MLYILLHDLIMMHVIWIWYALSNKMVFHVLLFRFLKKGFKIFLKCSVKTMYTIFLLIRIYSEGKRDGKNMFVYSSLDCERQDDYRQWDRKKIIRFHLYLLIFKLPLYGWNIADTALNTKQLINQLISIFSLVLFFLIIYLSCSFLMRNLQ